MTSAPSSSPMKVTHRLCPSVTTQDLCRTGRNRRRPSFREQLLPNPRPTTCGRLSRVRPFSRPPLQNLVVDCSTTSPMSRRHLRTETSRPERRATSMMNPRRRHRLRRVVSHDSSLEATQQTSVCAVPRAACPRARRRGPHSDRRQPVRRDGHPSPAVHARLRRVSEEVRTSVAIFPRRSPPASSSLQRSLRR